MDLAEIKAAVERTRRFTHEIDGRQFNLVTPTQFEADVIMEEAQIVARTKRRIVATALRGWMHLALTDLQVPDAALPGEPLVYSPEMAELLLDARSDWENELFTVIGARVQERRNFLEGQKGN